jgi:hypothetical protein
LQTSQLVFDNQKPHPIIRENYGGAMGLSILVTTEEQRMEIAFQLLSTAHKLETGGVRGAICLKHRNHDVSYNPKRDIFGIKSTCNRGDLLDLFCLIRGIKRAEGGDLFCTEFGLDTTYFYQRKEIMNYVGFIPSVVNEDIGSIFRYLSLIDAEQVEELIQEFGWTESMIKEYKVTLYQKGERVFCALTVSDKNSKIVGFRLIHPETGELIRHIKQQKAPMHLFPDPNVYDKKSPVLITIGDTDAILSLSKGIAATGIVNWEGDFTINLNKYFKGRVAAIAFPADKFSQNDTMMVADLLHPIAEQVYLVKWPEAMGMPETKGQSLYEYFHEHGGTMESLNDLLIPFTSGDPLPLRRELQQAVEYPVDALPPVIRDAVLDVCAAMQCSSALPAQSFLAVTSLSVQGQRNVEIDGRTSPSSSFFVTIAESGERKSSIDRLAMAPVIKREFELRALMKREMVNYNIQMAIRKKQESDALKSSFPEQAFRELGPPPDHPLDGSLTCEEPTYEGLIVKMVHGQPSLGIFSDEGGRFLGGAAMNRDNQQKSVTGLSTLWDGRAVTRTRVADGNSVMDGRRLSIHLMLQPAIADQLLNNEMLISQGIMSRILFAFPPSNIGNREYSYVNLNESVALQRFNEVIGEILKRELPIRAGTTNELEPPALTLTDDAKERWIAFHNQVEADMREGRQYASIRGFTAKAAEHVARLACVITYIDNPEADSIPIEWVNSAIRIVEYHLSETLRLFNVCQDSPDVKLAQKSLDWLRANFPTFSLVELYQNGPNQVRSQPVAARIVKILEHHGWVRPIAGGAFIGLKKRKIAWEIIA